MQLNKISDRLVKNHRLYQRDFPWRHKKEPYEIMIAEFMLHRTRAEQVVPVYTYFLHTYPDVKTLSTATYEEMAVITKHLGLHWRSAHFLDAARFIVEHFDCKIPADREALLKIPGVGDYASGAILTVVFNLREHVIDSNIARFINRYCGLKLTGEIRRKKVVKEKAIELFDYENTRQLLFALLDFTALVCKPRKPLCHECIFEALCKGKFPI